MMTEIEIRNKKYNIDMKIKKGIISILMEGGESFVKFMEFFTDDEIQDYFDSFLSVYNKNNNIFKQMQKVLQKHKGLSMFLLYATIMKNVDVGLTFTCDKPHSYQTLMNLFDEAAFFVLKGAYEQFISGKDVLGRVDSQGKNPTTFVTSYQTANSVMTEIMKKQDLQEQKRIFSKKLGFNENYLDNQPELYLLKIDGKKLKSDAISGNKIKIHLPNGIEPGVNEFWIVGGYTSGGMPEVVINGLPNIKKYIPIVAKYEIGQNTNKIVGPINFAHKYSTKIK